MNVSPKGFTQKELKTSYYSLSKIYHPDKNPDPAAVPKFIQIKLGTTNITYIITYIIAYDILGDSDKRLFYDVH